MVCHSRTEHSVHFIVIIESQHVLGSALLFFFFIVIVINNMYVMQINELKLLSHLSLFFVFLSFICQSQQTFMRAYSVFYPKMI